MIPDLPADIAACARGGNDTGYEGALFVLEVLDIATSFVALAETVRWRRDGKVEGIRWQLSEELAPVTTTNDTVSGRRIGGVNSHPRILVNSGSVEPGIIRATREKIAVTGVQRRGAWVGVAWSGCAGLTEQVSSY